MFKNAPYVSGHNILCTNRPEHLLERFRVHYHSLLHGPSAANIHMMILLAIGKYNSEVAVFMIDEYDINFVYSQNLGLVWSRYAMLRCS